MVAKTAPIFGGGVAKQAIKTVVEQLNLKSPKVNAMIALTLGDFLCIINKK